MQLRKQRLSYIFGWPNLVSKYQILHQLLSASIEQSCLVTQLVPELIKSKTSTLWLDFYSTMHNLTRQRFSTCDPDLLKIATHYSFKIWASVLINQKFHMKDIILTCQLSERNILLKLEENRLLHYHACIVILRIMLRSKLRNNTGIENHACIESI